MMNLKYAELGKSGLEVSAAIPPNLDDDHSTSDHRHTHTHPQKHQHRPPLFVIPYFRLQINRIWPITLLLFLPFLVWQMLTDFDPEAHRLPFGRLGYSSSFASVDLFIASHPEIISICHPKWHGIRAATYGQGNPVLEVPGIVSSQHQRRLLKFIAELQHSLKVVVINGIPPMMVPFLYEMKRRFPHIRIHFIYHGSVSQEFHIWESGLLNEMIIAARSGVVDRVGIVKTGMVETFNSFGVEAKEIWNFPNSSLRLNGGAVRPTSGDLWKIGVFGSRETHKNVIAQIIAACRFPNAHIYVRERPNVPYLQHCRGKIIETGQLAHAKFLSVLAAMDITLYVSLTEAFPMTVVESISYGIPAIVSPTSSVYSLNGYINDHLTVIESDSPDAIVRRIEWVMENYDAISEAVLELVPKITLHARSLWREFMEY